MHIENLILFNKIIEEKSISKVAGKTHISQPALSQQIHKLEDSVNVKLLERSNKGIEMTEAGQVVYKYSKQLQGIYETMIEELNQLSRGNQMVRIAAAPIVGSYAIPCCLYKATKKFVDFTFDLKTLFCSEVERQVIQGQADFGFTIGQAENPELYSKLIFTDSLHLVGGKGYSGKPRIEIEDLKQLPLINLTENFRTTQLLLQYIKKFNMTEKELKILYKADSVESVKASVLTGHGMAFLPYIAMKKELYQKQLKMIEIEDFNLRYEVYMVYKIHYEEDPRLAQVVKYFENSVKKTIC